MRGRKLDDAVARTGAAWSLGRPWRKWLVRRLMPTLGQGLDLLESWARERGAL